MKKVLLITIVFYLAAVFLKIHFFKSIDYFNPNDETCFFWTEDAIQYRYARMIADGTPIPEHDPKLQYPEGIRPFRSLTIGMELVAGNLYRLLGLKIPFHLFIGYFVAFFSSLSIFAAALLSFQVWKSRLAALASGFFYAFAIPTYSRSVGRFIREDFAMPFLFLGLFLFLKALDEKRRKKITIMALSSGTVLALGMSFWHLGRFYLITVAAVVFLFYLFGTTARGKLTVVLSWMLVPLGLFSVLVPALRVNMTILSPGMVILAAIVCTELVCKVRPNLPRWVCALGLTGAFLGIGLLITPVGEYAHVYSLILDKVRFFGVKPADPGRLSYETRSMWIGAFLSPDPPTLVYFFLLLFIPAIGGLWESIDLIKKRTVSKGLFFVLWLSSFYFLLYLLISRMGVLFCFFLAVFLGGAVLFIRHHVKAKVVYIILLAGVALFHAYVGATFGPGNIFRTAAYSFVPGQESDKDIVPNWQAHRVNIIRWIRHNTNPMESFLAPIGMSAAVLTFADRPILLHSKYETRRLREKVKGFIYSLYATEDDLYKYCRDNDASYVLYEPYLALEKGTSSYRYRGDSLMLKRTAPAFLFQFYPEGLKHFELVYQNPTYRIFKVVEEKRGLSKQLPYQPLFDIALFEKEQEGEYFNDSQTPKVLERLDNATDLYNRAFLTGKQGKLAEGIRLMETALSIWPNLLGGHDILCNLYFYSGDLQKAFEECQKELALSPYNPLVHHDLGSVYAYGNRLLEAKREFEIALTLDPSLEMSQSMLKEVERRLGLQSEPGKL